MAVSIVLGPALPLASYALYTRGGGDVCDAASVAIFGRTDTLTTC